MSEESYDIQELVERSGVARRNIHFYVQQGLLPPPVGAGLGARYTIEHLYRLRMIPLLRTRGMRLDQIRERLAGLPPQDLERLLAEMEGMNGTAVIPLPGPLPAAVRTGQACTLYQLPGGIQIIVPSGLRPEYKRLADRIVAAGERMAKEDIHGN
jgi:DNA-binding transcriptional MerR regulator